MISTRSLDILLPTSLIVTVMTWAIQSVVNGDVLVHLRVDYVFCMLCPIPWSTVMTIVIWTTLYALFGWIVHSVSGLWLQPFLDDYEPSVLMWCFYPVTILMGVVTVAAGLLASNVYLSDLVGSSSHRFLPLYAS
ncbi:hypothetical protein Ae201684_013825 [Aphanomyces euteiches]|uniref:Uncharacterized protein n=1 Tax=Aphanomyces euteiches TaxID=100861 RepID=A0A6G0WMB1_9STRA|nr:hypothetical protein Ae201684_013825 [Aphanomyces euteiches]KAH9155518.1 hypothetical protein AeRB84_002507 [Aphanomyces euteiches]